MLRALVLSSVLVLASSCSLFEPQYVELSPDQVAQITATAGDLNTETLDAWIAEAERMLGVKVTGIVEAAEKRIVEVAPAAEEASEAAGDTLFETLQNNPTPAGIIAGAAAALFAILRVFSRRKRLEVK